MTTYKDELYHYGVKGQKWGVRRYQNTDGSLTAAGREHYGEEVSRFKKDYKRANDNKTENLKTFWYGESGKGLSKGQKRQMYNDAQQKFDREKAQAAEKLVSSILEKKGVSQLSVSELDKVIDEQTMNDIEYGLESSNVYEMKLSSIDGGRGYDVVISKKG